ncbi:calcium-binding protein [Nocardioides sp. CER19]|uniref:calcium-binding protein n=1 Tax=Nocardioides sp. CER19 TaxID=3038538 RepID=UPI00244CB07C|nr:calcium-binding protein [Nocardioides sp. CER19]MDH2416852.1 calcium-binding protein [Nocardioides sp. CER19]
MSRILRTAGRAAVVVAVVLVGTLFVSAQAQAYTARGERCTIVGTKHADVLVGTNRRDVICGRGGNDVIRARGGNDVVDAGPGRDRVDGGTGADQLRGRSGDDTILGGAGRDHLYGDAGNDDLDGGPGADVLTGGPGTNWCGNDPADAGSQCKHDTAAPVIVSAQVLPTTVDVGSGPEDVLVRAHITDDTGVAWVLGGLGIDIHVDELRLVSGTVRDGWWQAQAHLDQWTAPGTFALSISVNDWVGHNTFRNPLGTLRVTNSHPDLTPPAVVQLLSPAAGATVDVRTAARTLTISARVTDADSGVTYVGVGASYRGSDGYWSGGTTMEEAALTRGTAADGVWTGSVTIPRGSIGGTWNITVATVDRAGRQLTYLGPDAYADETTDGRVSPNAALPGGAGAITVLGTSDTHAPQLVSASVDPTQVDTLNGPVSVHVSLHVTDVEGVTEVQASLLNAENLGAPGGSLVLASGTARDGIWTGDVVLPAGTPPDTYRLGAMLVDLTHLTFYGPGYIPIPGAPQVVVVPSP